MLAVFALRLAAGMLACLLLLPRSQVHPRFYRTHFLIALGLACLATAFAPGQVGTFTRILLIGSIVLAFTGSVVWSLEGAPGGLALTVLTVAVLGGALGLLDVPITNQQGEETDIHRTPSEAAVANITSAALLGASLSAMLMGHSYLISPGMSLQPLLRLIASVGIAVLARGAVDAYALWCWTAAHPSVKLGNDLLLWLPLRWLTGFIMPLGLIVMAWQTTRIRSTQSATGILYVVVIFCFLGELTDQLIRDAGITF